MAAHVVSAVRTDTAPRNWGGGHVYAHRRLARPETVEDLVTLVRDARKVRVLGTRHSFNEIADSEDLLVDLTGLARRPLVDRDAQTVRVTPGTRFAEVVREVAAAGLALPNLGSLPHISVCGAMATGTHGSGVGNRVLAASVSGLQLLDGRERTVDLARGEDDFDGVVVGLGAVGVVLSAELDLVPAYRLAQTRDVVTWSTAMPTVADELASAYSVSVFTRWSDEDPTEIVRKSSVVEGSSSRRTDSRQTPRSAPSRLLGEGPHLTPMDRPVDWWQALPHFTVDHEPSFGEEIQSEFFVPREHTGAALEAVTGIAGRIRPHLIASEVRSVARDDLWMSPAHGRDSTCLHFTWHRRPEEVAQCVSLVQLALAGLDARPHWGKVFDPALVDVGSRWPRARDFVALRDRFDPEERYVNPWLAGLLPA